MNFSAEWFLASMCSCVIKLNYSSGSGFAILNSETIVRALIKHRGNKQRSQKLNSWIDEGKCNTEKMIMLLAVLVLGEIYFLANWEPCCCEQMSLYQAGHRSKCILNWKETSFKKYQGRGEQSVCMKSRWPKTTVKVLCQMWTGL